jgi:trans-aconitate 2-methyltransferase
MLPPARLSSSSKSREWNAAEYHRLSAPQFQWGQRVLNDLHLRGDECVLDAGCGTGKLTRLLLENLPRGRVVGLDLSCNMVKHAHADLASQFGDRVRFVAADFLALPFHDAFDGVFSTASFHWVADHDALFRSIFVALRAGGWLHAQCGGGPNIARLRKHVRVLSGTAEFSQWLAGYPEPWFFSDAESAASRLQSAGFDGIHTDLETAAVTVSTSEEFQEYLRTFVLHRHLELLPNDALRRELLQDVAARTASDGFGWTLDYTRLNLRARKPVA